MLIFNNNLTLFVSALWMSGLFILYSYYTEFNWFNLFG